MGQQVVEHVVHGDRAQQVTFVVDHRPADQIVGSEVTGQRGQRGLWYQAGQIGVDYAADQRCRRLAKQPLQVYTTQIAAGRSGRRRPHHEHQRGKRGCQVGITGPGQRLRDRRVRGEDHRLRGHQPARGIGRVLQQPPHRIGIFRIHPGQQHLGLGGIQYAEQVCGVVRVHRLEHVGGTLGVQLHEHVGLVVLGQLLKDVGQPVVVQRVDDLVASLGRQLANGVRDLDRALPFELMQQLCHSLTGHRQCGRCQALHVLPVGDVNGGASPQPAVAAHRDARHHPVAGPDLLDAQIDDHDVDPGQLRQLGIVDPHPGVQDLTEHQHLAGPLREAAQRHVGGGQCHRAGLDGGDPQDGHENSSTREQFDDQPQHARLLADDTHADHDIADSAEGFTVRPQDKHPREPCRVHPVHRRHG